MIKIPVVGKVKTRLAREIGLIPATYFYRHTLHALLRRLSNSSIWTTILAITPDTYPENQCLPHKLPRLRQGTGNLGQRLQRIFDRLLPTPTLVIGSDVPSIRNQDITKAFRQLSGRKAIIGPSHDGGYWLIGLRACNRSQTFFNSVIWSSNKTLQSTLNNFDPKEVGIIECFKDIDVKADYQSEAHLIGRNTISPFLKNMASTKINKMKT